MLATALTAENHERVLAAATGKKTREVRRLAASLAPQPDVPAWIRKLPERKADASGCDGGSADLAQLTMADQPPLGTAEKATSPGAGASRVPNPASTPSPEASSSSATPTSCGSSSPAATAPRDRATVAPLREDRFKVQFSAGTQLRDKLQKAEELLGPRHAGGVAKGDIAGVVERALDELIEILEKRRFAKTPCPQKKPRTRRPGTRYIPRHVRREVAERDGGRCTFVDDKERRGEERRALEFHHRHAFALGGEATAASLKLLCHPHNALEAERDFGAEHIERTRRGKGALQPHDGRTIDEGAGSSCRSGNRTLHGAKPPRPLQVLDGAAAVFSAQRISSLRREWARRARGERRAAR